jgi:hypothetical protein
MFIESCTTRTPRYFGLNIGYDAYHEVEDILVASACHVSFELAPLYHYVGQRVVFGPSLDYQHRTHHNVSKKV